MASLVGIARWVARVVGVSVAIAVVATTAQATPGRSPIVWHACPAGSVAAAAGGFTCATVRVPLDYAAPNGPTIVLALVKHAATDPGRRIGTLFTNPGGPAGQGLTQIPGWIDFFPQPLRARFDIVSWDPRGVGFSTAVQCFPSADAEAAFPGDNADVPLTAAQQPAYIKTWAAFGARCAARNGALLAHVSTADTARDLDRLRALVGEPKLTYIGLSYGTILGATYANLFPDRVRALVLDGNIAPSNWRATPPADAAQSISMRIGTVASTCTTFGDFLTLCGTAGPSRCAFSAGTPTATRAKFAALLTRLRSGPIVLGSKTVTYADLLSEISEALLLAFPHPNERVRSQAVAGWSGAATALERIWEARDAPVATPAAAPNASAPGSSAPAAPVAPAAAPYAGPEQALSIECSDVPVPPASAFPATSAAVERRYGPIGVAALWGDVACASWPIRTAPGIYRGPWNRRTAAPILVIGNTTDPSTPYANAVGMANELAAGRLLTVHGYGHTALLNPSACANAAIVAYVIDGTLPRRGKVCPQNAAPF
jgi:pimeloyl-ACP methyl ester carboxylesterase